MLKPLSDHIIAEPIEPESRTAGGMLLPEQAKEKPQTAEVLAVGKDVEEVEVGDKILFDQYGVKKYKRGVREIIVIKEEDILARIQD